MVSRTTTGGVLRNYKYNLQRSFNTLTAARDTVLSQRTFQTFAEDPATATQCFQLRRAMLRTNTQYNVGANVAREYDIAYSALDSILSRVDNDINYYNSDYNAILRSLNDPVGGGRLALGQAMREMAEGMVQTMNAAKYGDIFVFGGSDGLNIPFTWEKNADGDLRLFYRGVPLDAMPTKAPSSTAITQTAEYQPASATFSFDLTQVNPAFGSFDPALASQSIQLDINGTPITVNYPADADGMDAFMQSIKAEISNQFTNYDVDYDGTSISLTLSPYTAGTDANSLTITTTGANPSGSQTVTSTADVTPERPAAYTLDLDGINIDGKGTADFTIGGKTYTLDVSSDDTASTIAEKLAKALQRSEDENGNLDGLAVEYNIRTDGKGKIIFTEKTPDTATPPNATYDVKFDVTNGAVDKLKYYSTEGVYVDIGIGLAEDGTGKLIQSSAFNSALPGINFLGWGVDEDGDPLNIISLSWKMGEILSRCNPDDGAWASDQDRDDYQRLAGKFEDAAQRLKEQHTVLTTRKSFLDTNQQQLSDSYFAMNEQLDAIERVDLADAISSFSWAQYCYNAALKMGNSILSQSLMDYIN